MGVSVAIIHDTVNTSTGIQTFTKSGFGTPKAAMVIVNGATIENTAANHSRMSIGFTDGTNQVVCTKREEHGVGSTDSDNQGTTDELIMMLDTNTNSVECEANFSQWITDGIEINWGVAPLAAYKITVILFGGSDVDAHVGTVTGNATENASVTVTGVGFESDIVLAVSRGNDPIDDTPKSGSDLYVGFAHNDKAGGILQRSLNQRGSNNQTTGDPRARLQTDRIVRRPIGSTTSDVGCEITSFNSDGWVNTTRDDSDILYYGYLALNFNGAVQSYVGSVTHPTVTGNNSQTGPGFKPQFVLQFCSDLLDNAQDTGANAGAFGISMVTGSDEIFMSFSEEDGVTTTDTQSHVHQQAIDLKQDSGALSYEATFVSFDPLGWTYNYPNVRTGPRLGIALAIEETVNKGNFFKVF